MQLTKRLLGVGAGAAAAVALLGSGSAMAAFPDFSDCPRRNAAGCLHIASRGGSMTIKRTTVPIGESFQLRGAVANDGTFVPPTGTTGVFSKPINVPGGILGIDFPIPGNAVTAITQLAGSPSQIRVLPDEFRVRMPVKLKLDNPILGPWCSIGSNSRPVNLDLIIGTTNPPAPNRPITGSVGTGEFIDNVIIARGSVNVDNAFSIPSADTCGIDLGLVNGLVNLKLGLPSAAGNNTLIIRNDLALQVLY